jgi:hypothetical protein
VLWGLVMKMRDFPARMRSYLAVSAAIFGIATLVAQQAPSTDPGGAAGGVNTDPPPGQPLPPIRLDPPTFPVERPPHDLAPCICGPLVGNYMSNQIEVWHVQADGGSLDLRLTTKTVNPVDPQTTIVTVFDGTNVVGSVTVSYTAAEAASHPLGWEKSVDLPLGIQPPGKVFRIESRIGGTPQTQTHYWLKFCGARWLALDSPSFKALEEDHAAYRFRVLPTESLDIDLDNTGIPTPAMDFFWRLLDPTGAVVSTGVRPIVPAVEFSLPTPMPGLWTLEMHPIGGEHYLLDKRTGSDRYIYLDWHTSQRGEKVVEIELNGRPAMGIPFEVSMLRRRPLGSGWTNDLILQQLVTNGVGRLSKLPNGYYDVTVRPLAPGIPPVPSQLDLILCDQPVTNRFVFQGDVPVDHGKGEDFGDAPGLETRRSDDGARHEIRPGWFLGVGVDPDADGVPSARADADDFHALDDEDGVFLPPALVAGSTVPVRVVASTNGVLNAWLDFNRDGDWSDPGERICHLVPLATGTNNLVLNVPTNVVFGNSFSRWRFFAPGGVDLPPFGPATEGEVEDHLVELRRASDEGGGKPPESSGGAVVDTDGDRVVVSSLPPDASGGVVIPAQRPDSRWLRYELEPVSLRDPASRLVFVERFGSSSGPDSLAKSIATGLEHRLVLEGGDTGVTITNLMGSWVPNAVTVAWFDGNAGVRGDIQIPSGATVRLLGTGDVTGFVSLPPQVNSRPRVSGSGVRFSAPRSLEFDGVVRGTGSEFNWFVRLPDGLELPAGGVAGVEIRAALPGGSFVVQGEQESSDPVATRIRATRRDSGQFRLDFQPEPGMEQVIESATQPEGPWTELDRRVGTFLPEFLEVPPTNSIHLFRVRSQP